MRLPELTMLFIGLALLLWNLHEDEAARRRRQRREDEEDEARRRRWR